MLYYKIKILKGKLADYIGLTNKKVIETIILVFFSCSIKVSFYL